MGISFGYPGLIAMCRYVSAIISDSCGRLLLRYTSYKSWQTLGGEVDHGESPKEAFIRLTGEKAGMIFDDAELVEIMRKSDGRQIHVFNATLNEDDMQRIYADKHLALFDENELDGLNLWSETRFVLDKMKRLLRH